MAKNKSAGLSFSYIRFGGTA